MISTRGPEQILVVDRVAVPVSAVCDAVIQGATIADILSKLPINEEEMFAAVDAVVGIVGVSDSDFISFKCEKDDEDVSVETVKVTDNVFLNALLFDREQRPGEQDIYALYAYGIESIMFDCLVDIVNGDCYYKNSSIHNMVYESFCKAFGVPTPEEVQGLLDSLIDEGISK
jgi:hypothetical protein